MTYKEKDTARGRFLLAFTKHDPGAAFRWVQGDKPELSSIPNGSADVVLIENIHNWDPAKLGGYLHEILKSMRAGGLLRVITPNLDAVIHAYLLDCGDSRDCSRASRFNEWRRTTNAQFVFNEEHLRRVLTEAGFVDLQHFVAGASSDPLFWDAGGADKTLLVLEARKPKDVL